MVIRRVGPISCAKIVGTLYGVLGIFMGFMFWLFATAGAFAGARAAETQYPYPYPIIFGPGAFVVFPIVYACLGFIGALIAASLYNAIAGVVGGIELETE